MPHHIDASPDEQRHESTWGNDPNELSDPARAHALYPRNTRDLRLAEDLGTAHVEDTPGVQEKERSR